MMMKRIFALVTLLAAFAAGSRAVTPEELEQARTHAAIVYLRNANPGSDYLDKVSVGSRSALRAKLRNDKDRDNLELFNRKLPSTSGYESWDKEKLSDYAQKAVSAPGNYQSTGFARSQVKKRISAMAVKAPSGTARPADDTQTRQPEEQPAEEPVAVQAPADSVPAAVLPDAMDTRQAEADSALSAAEDSLMAQQPQQQEVASSGSNTVYIVILCILVALVVVLVVYAARYFSRQEKEKRGEERFVSGGEERSVSRGEERFASRGEERSVSGRPDPLSAPATPSRPTERREDRDTHRRSRVEPELEPDDNPQRVIESLRAENRELRRACEEYKYHINYLKSEKEKADADRARTGATTALGPQARAEEHAPVVTLNDRYTQRREQQQPGVGQAGPARHAETQPAPRPGQRIIYLGRANREGMFVRAERSLNPQHSLFRLQTTDNVSGTYTVADDPEVASRVLANPDLLMAVSCELEDTDTYGKESVDTVTPGTAIFEGGRWRVLRPALIRFI